MDLIVIKWRDVSSNPLGKTNSLLRSVISDQVPLFCLSDFIWLHDSYLIFQSEFKGWYVFHGLFIVEYLFIQVWFFADIRTTMWPEPFLLLVRARFGYCEFFSGYFLQHTFSTNPER